MCPCKDSNWVHPKYKFEVLLLEPTCLTERSNCCTDVRNFKTCYMTINFSMKASFILQWLYSLFVGPWPLIQFCNLFYTDGRTPWTSAHEGLEPVNFMDIFNSRTLEVPL
jgi:hypothetical protein